MEGMKLTPRLKQAIDAATRAHKEQMRGDGKTPYISHAFGVALQLANHCDDEDVIIAGLFHDVLEDVDSQVYGASEIERGFGSRVLAIVRGVTEDKALKPWQKRKQAYLDNLANASKEVLMVSAADLTHNIMSASISMNREGKAYGYFEAADHDTTWFWEARIKLLKDNLGGAIVSDLEDAYREFQDSKP
jgi:(p)ppGpp synthase/HD superfamily hydrolase